MFSHAHVLTSVVNFPSTPLRLTCQLQMTVWSKFIKNLLYRTSIYMDCWNVWFQLLTSTLLLLYVFQYILQVKLDEDSHVVSGAAVSVTFNLMISRSDQTHNTIKTSLLIILLKGSHPLKLQSINLIFFFLLLPGNGITDMHFCFFKS